ncbi:hypothetical protein ACQHIV_42220 (plasmid) [Kribbella sp. GL6]|uniref:hypothetical protein n=1 Tax=Kribbella sp. GL6 TaxID=3419765 RepID=UPI003D08EA29
MTDLRQGLEPAAEPAPGELALEPIRCVWSGCEGLTFPDRTARTYHGLEVHALQALALIHQPNPDLFKPKPSPEPVAELPFDWSHQ